MGDPVQDSVEKLKQSTAKLNQITDEAAQVVKSVEAFLNKECSVGISSYVEVTSALIDSEYGLVERTLLSYQRYEGKFRITVYVGVDDEQCTLKPWSEWDRITKLETIKKLPELLAAIAKDVDEHVKEAQQATSTVASVLLALDRKGAK